MLWGSSLCFVGYLAAFLASTYKILVALLPQNVFGHKQISPCGANHPSLRNTVLLWMWCLFRCLDFVFNPYEIGYVCHDPLRLNTLTCVSWHWKHLLHNNGTIINFDRFHFILMLNVSFWSALPIPILYIEPWYCYSMPLCSIPLFFPLVIDLV